MFDSHIAADPLACTRLGWAEASGKKGIRLLVAKTSDSRPPRAKQNEAEAGQPAKELSDQELLRLHLEGDERAFASLLNRYRKELFNFLARFTGNRALAEDVFQETFLQLHLSAATFDLSRRLKPWLFTIAANKARDAMRKISRKPAAPLDAVIGRDQGETRYVDLMPANIPQPDESLMNLETRQAVQNTVRDMPDNLRVVLLLNYFHGFPYKDIADILNVPLGTVKSRLHAAIKHFAKEWKALAESSEHEQSERH